MKQGAFFEASLCKLDPTSVRRWIASTCSTNSLTIGPYAMLSVRESKKNRLALSRHSWLLLVLCFTCLHIYLCYTHCYACSFHSQVSTCESEITHVNIRRKTNRGDLWGAIAMAAFSAAFEKAHGCKSNPANKAPRLEADPMLGASSIQRVLENYCNLPDGFVHKPCSAPLFVTICNSVPT